MMTAATTRTVHRGEANPVTASAQQRVKPRRRVDGEEEGRGRGEESRTGEMTRRRGEMMKRRRGEMMKRSRRGGNNTEKGGNDD